MSALDLTVDSVDNAASHGLSDAPRARYGGIIYRIRSFFISNKPLPRAILAGGTDYSEARVAAILRDFLQPETKLSLQEVAKSILVLIPANAAGNAEVFSFGEICVELAEQIPYDHPSQLKLAQLLHHLSMSPKFMYKYSLGPQEDCYRPFQLLWESLMDSLSGPDAENPNVWVNLNAFAANLFSTGIWGPSPGQALEMLRVAFESLERPEAWERDCNIMAAAQWILWHGQTLFKLVIFDGFEGAADDKGHWRRGIIYSNSLMEPRSIGRWRGWKIDFEVVEKNRHASRDCKIVAKKAACMMASLEEAMVSTTRDSCEDESTGSCEDVSADSCEDVSVGTFAAP